ncbi:MAG TPA: outer membrane beta-barrel protein [Candidatus Udaeobacter sp.]|nr:outer membrane beta-barrel protein [Candidatus Udaeobacter sp.]
MSQDAVAAASEAAGLGWLPAVPIQITAGMDIGYDDHVNASNPTTSSSGQKSFFARENLVLTYARPTEQTQVGLIGVGRFEQFFDLGTDDKNGNVTLSIMHHSSTRLSFYASVYAAYETEPDFKSDVGPENVRANHFNTIDIFSVTYQWLPRVSTVTSYTFQLVKYASASVGAGQDRTDSTFGETVQFSLTSRTNLVGDYRYQITDYDTAPIDSTTHYLLGGIDHHLTEHLIVHARGGPSLRSLKNDGDSTTPYFEGSLEYFMSNHSLNWTTSYGFEAPNEANASLRKTFRTGLVLTYNLTSRLSSTTGVYFHHDENQVSASSGTGSAGSQDTLDLSLGFGYTINKRLSLRLNYTHTSQSSLEGTPGYSRNSYSAGLTYAY